MGRKQYWLIAVLAVIAGFLGGAASGAFIYLMVQDNVISAREFRVLDKDGKTRASLGLSTAGESALNLFDREEKIRVQLQVTEEGPPGWGLFDEEGDPRLVVNLSENGSPALVLLQKERKWRAAFRLFQDGNPTLDFANEAGYVKSRLSVDGEIPMLSFYDNEEIVWSAP